MSICIYSKNLGETEKLAEKFASLIQQNGAFVCLYGEVGAGKTAFTSLVCKYLGVKEKVTSPSFVILNEYKSGVIPIYHFDLYRLEKEGVSTIVNELEEYSEGRLVTFVEWAEFSQNILPFKKIDVNIEYVNENEREFRFSATGEDNEKIINGLSK